MRKRDTKWKEFFEVNSRYADVINGIGRNGLQLVKADDLEESKIKKWLTMNFRLEEWNTMQLDIDVKQR